MANNAMGMFFGLIIVVGAVVAYVKRDEISKMFGGKGGPFRQDFATNSLNYTTKSRINNDKDAMGKFIDKSRAEDLEVTVPQSDGGFKVFNQQPTSKFARISYF